jgi:hypothetical protein
MSPERPSKAVAPKFSKSALRTRKPDAFTLTCDRRREFCSPAFTEACLKLGVQIAYLPPRQTLVHRPYHKAQVERLLADINRQLTRPPPL